MDVQTEKPNTLQHSKEHRLSGAWPKKAASGIEGVMEEREKNEVMRMIKALRSFEPIPRNRRRYTPSLTRKKKVN